ncbi:hypothetical protein FRB94_006493 [Tulasnella sp. JGI-2019a]|nr:hypothetical protein FRB94_006493 [Tulasnella sp. JGI-2019a]
MRMSSGIITPASLTDTSVSLSPTNLPVELDKFHKALQDNDDLRSKLEFALDDNRKLLTTLEGTLGKLEDLEDTHKKIVEANEVFNQMHEAMEQQRKGWEAANASFTKRILKNKAAKRELEERCSSTFAELCEMDAQYTKAEKEIAALKDEIAVLRAATADASRERRSGFSQLNDFDECIVLSVEGHLFHVSRRLLQRESLYFEEILEQSQASGDTHIGETNADPIVLVGVTAQEMNDFLGLIYTPPFQTNFDHINIHQWASILKIASLWSFKATKAYAITVFDTRFTDEDPFDRLDHAFQCGVPKWVRPAYATICLREEPLSADEGRRLGWERYAAICRIRELAARGMLSIWTRSYDYLSHFLDTSPELDTVDSVPVPSANETIELSSILSELLKEHSSPSTVSAEPTESSRPERGSKIKVEQAPIQPKAPGRKGSKAEKAVEAQYLIGPKQGKKAAKKASQVSEGDIEALAWSPSYSVRRNSAATIPSVVPITRILR